MFAASVCGDEVVHPKPHPEPYLTAAALVGANPEQCVAIEAGECAGEVIGVQSVERLPALAPRLDLRAVDAIHPGLVGP